MLIQFGKLKIKLLIPLLFPIFLDLRRLFRGKNNIISPFLKGFNDFLSMIFCGIFYIIIKLNTKSSKKIKRKTIKTLTGKKEDIDLSALEIHLDHLILWSK